MVTYQKLQRKERSLKALTGLSKKEFEALCLEASFYWERRFERKDRKRKVGGGRKSKLPLLADELVLLLFFYRHYPAYEVLSWLFDLDISNVSRHIKKTEKVLWFLSRKRLQRPRGAAKIKTIKELYEKFPELTELIGDATEFPVRSPKDKKKRKSYFSGRKKRHTAKVQFITDKKERIYDVSASYPGRNHDKKVMGLEKTPDKIPRKSILRLDSGYEKIQKEYPENRFVLPKKANRWQKLNKTDHKKNKMNAKKRIKIEHIIGRLKHYKILSEVYRHNTAGHNRTVKNICGLYNFRLDLAALT